MRTHAIAPPETSFPPPEKDFFSLPKRAKASRGGEKVSIIIPTLNQIAYTKRCIESIGRYTQVSYEVIVIDNGSTDNSTQELMKFQEDMNLTIIRNDRNLGFGQANNQGAKLASGEFLLFLNNDTEVLREGWLIRLLSEVEDGVGLVGGSGGLLEDDNKDEILRYKYATIKEAYNYIEGWCMFIKRELFEEIRGFDKDFGLALSEDADLSFKVKDKGFNIKVVEGLGGWYVRHYGSKTLKAQKDFDVGIMEYKNAKILHEKWRDRVGKVLKREELSPKILLIREAAIGDVLMTTALFPALKEKYPEHKIYFKTNPLCYHLLLNNPYLENIFTNDTSGHYDLTFNLRYEDEPQTNAVDVFAKNCDIKLKSRKPHIYLTEDEMRFAEDLLDKSQRYVVFHTGRTWKGKECDIRVFEMIKDYVRLVGYKTIEVGRTDTLPIGANIDLRGKTSVRQTASVVSKCKIFIGLDSLVSHIAKAFDLPSIVLYGATNPEILNNGNFEYPVMITKNVDVLLRRIIEKMEAIKDNGLSNL